MALGNSNVNVYFCCHWLLQQRETIRRYFIVTLLFTSAKQKVHRMGIEPTTLAVLRPRYNQLNHRCILTFECFGTYWILINSKPRFRFLSQQEVSIMFMLFSSSSPSNSLWDVNMYVACCQKLISLVVLPLVQWQPLPLPHTSTTHNGKSKVKIPLLNKKRLTSQYQ